MIGMAKVARRVCVRRARDKLHHFAKRECRTSGVDLKQTHEVAQEKTGGSQKTRSQTQAPRSSRDLPGSGRRPRPKSRVAM